MAQRRALLGLPPDSARASERVLLLLDGARNRELTKTLLERAGIEVYVCTGLKDLSVQIEAGGAAALVAEEELSSRDRGELDRVLRRQPPWSDFPLVIFGVADESRLGESFARVERFANVTFLDRPVRMRSMLAAVRGAIRSRRRQYDARRAIDARDAFLAMLGHELRNPLGAIRLAIGVLEQKTPEADLLREHAIIARQSEHLTRLVDDLLDVARVTHGKVTIERERVDVVETCRAAFETLETRARASDLAFSIVVPHEPLWVIGDRHRLHQVFSNVLTNAIKYTPRGGSVSMDARAEGDAIVVRVADTGVGLARHMLERVFDTFTQADRTLDRSQGGLGLGLAVVRTVVELHDGHVSADSDGLGRGATFVIRLPAAQTGIIRPAAPSQVRAVSPRSDHERIVVVEDNADIRELMVEMLTQDGHEVVVAEDGPDGLAKILEVAPRVALVDLGLPGFDGFELARRTRAAGSSVRLVAISGYGRAEDKARSAQAGFDEHLTKPISGPELARAIGRRSAG